MFNLVFGENDFVVDEIEWLFEFDFDRALIIFFNLGLFAYIDLEFQFRAQTQRSEGLIYG